MGSQVQVLPGAPTFRLSQNRGTCPNARGRAPSHRSCDLRLRATRGVTIAVVSSLERKRRPPGLAADGPEFVRSEEHTSALQSLMRISDAILCWKTKPPQR